MEIALVGIGKIAVDQHIPAISDNPDWELAATVSRHGTVKGVPAFTDFDTMLEERPEIRVVSLCLPPVPRFDYAQKAILAGRHVMLEKPPGATLSECHTLEALARKHRVSLYATWHSRQADKVAAAKDWLSDRRLRKLAIRWREDVRQWHPGQDWVFEAGGLGVFDPGINALSILTEILPVPVHLTGAELHFPENRDTPIAAQCAFHHPDGAEVTMDLDWLEPGTPTWTIEAETDTGHMLLENGGGTLTIDGQTHDARPGLSGEYPRLYAQMAELVASGGIDMDLAPLCHVADAFLLGRRIAAPRFDW
ncbi:Gfo/Idh/MocA family protein [Sagittula stellata]|uniref:D-galactose-1-dehydrogenase protein n=1 Tax=Sagittula stellata (strain ATCC 700073 / DSM 11524 / E-37) TaxID=388399 RepID=A3K1I0_SAGS3|nr:Gfo/Idh/MocA family oxidoreductase [Sagittula stellata]EBA08776.1 D-galactose-1-dehydrogenase protein [Sagittula stellata E-37]